MPNRFEDVAGRFEALCRQYDIPVPRIVPSLETDPCDFTSPEEVRLNVGAAGVLSIDLHARHVFGHYLCDLHCWEPEDPSLGGWADPVASLIAEWIAKSQRWDQLANAARSMGRLLEIRAKAPSLVQSMPEGAMPTFWQVDKGSPE